MAKVAVGEPCVARFDDLVKRIVVPDGSPGKTPTRHAHLKPAEAEYAKLQ